MTSDAKVGLLLGLVFIFIIAFIINGLPRFHTETNNNELTTNMVRTHNAPLGIGAQERKAQEIFNRARRSGQESVIGVPVVSEDKDDVRYEVLLPGSDSATKERLVVKSANDNKPAAQPENITERITFDIKPTASEPANERSRINIPRPVKAIVPKVYVVSKGDNLAVIAKKFYGPEEGNRRVNITRIFEANRDQLESPDDIYIGQKLIVPPLAESGDDETGGGIFSSSIFEKVKSIGQRSTTSVKTNTEKNRRYIVREDDSLWSIANRELGDGTRYKEISRLNADILDDEDHLDVGMRLKLPAR